MFFFFISKQYILTFSVNEHLLRQSRWTSFDASAVGTEAHTPGVGHSGRKGVCLKWKKKASRTLIDVWIVNYMYQEQMTRNMERSFEFLCLPYWWKWSLHVRELVLSGSRFNDITEKHIIGLTSYLHLMPLKWPTHLVLYIKEHGYDLRTRSHDYILSVARFYTLNSKTKYVHHYFFNSIQG